MANITISELRPDESFLTELESDVLTARIVGGKHHDGYDDKKYYKKVVKFARKKLKFGDVKNKFKFDRKGKGGVKIFIDTFNNFGQIFVLA